MRYRPGAHRSFRPRHRHWLRGLVLAVLVLAVLCAAPAFAESGAQDEPGSRMVECAECGG